MSRKVASENEVKKFYIKRQLAKKPDDDIIEARNDDREE